MKTYYDLRFAWKRSCIEIRPNIKLIDYLDYWLPFWHRRLPEDTKFSVKAGKKEYDIIGVNRCMDLHMYSNGLIYVLNQFTDMSKYCYKIDLSDVIKEYYVIYNLPTNRWISAKESKRWLNDPWLDFPRIRFIIGKNDYKVFSTNERGGLLVSEEVKRAIEKAKITNVEFEEAYGYTPEEALEWARENPDLADDFADKAWFKKLLSK